MTEEITYGLEWCALPEKMHGQSMSKNVRTAKARYMHSGAHCPKIEHIKDCGRLDRTPRCTDTQEKSPLAGLPSTLAQVLHQGCSDFVRERHDQRRAYLGPRYANHPGAPLDVVNIQTGYFASAKTIGRDQEQHGVVPTPLHRGAIDATQQ